MNRSAFMSLVRATMSQADADTVELAYQFSKMVHRGQTRKELDADGKPLRYFEHVRRAALVVLQEAGIVNPAVVCATLLHDTIEDSEEVMVVSTIVERLFGTEVANLVRLVTKVPKEGYMARMEAGFFEAKGLHMIVKAADRLDNLRSLPVPDPDVSAELRQQAPELAAVADHKRNQVLHFRERQRTETRDVLLPLFAKAERFLPSETHWGFQKLVREIRSLV